MSKIVETNEKIAEGVTEGMQKIEDGVVGGYKKIEDVDSKRLKISSLKSF